MAIGRHRPAAASDINSTYGAWWISLRTIVQEVGAEAVEEKLEEFEDEIKRLRAQAIKEAVEDSSDDDLRRTGDVRTLRETGGAEPHPSGGVRAARP